MIASVLASLRRKPGAPRAFGGAIRLLLGAAAALVVIMAAAGYLDFELRSAGESEEVAPPLGDEGQRRIENPRYTTRLENGVVLLISADWALPDGDGQNRIRLDSVVARSEDAAGAARTARASVGYLMPRENILLLEGAEFFGAGGERLAAPRMTVDTEANTVRAEGPVVFEAPGTRVEAGRALGYPADDGGWRNLLEGGVRAVYAGSAGKPAP